jgi:hypothetical protein
MTTVNFLLLIAGVLMFGVLAGIIVAKVKTKTNVDIPDFSSNTTPRKFSDEEITMSEAVKRFRITT